ncbi:mechanosensitive ion channel [Leifsonia sp. ZF2019]|uniref:mechanosensitive ion channel domain-containing protein n=1 Tax=Leifsonia sp. ZF2019 TaxID=2781978 RepID=UPI001CBFDE74|nr:mechanosensitive ion channel family protein [Leifsonia sp. ZF2019]UAJ80119.1 mechanosensitive ion channel [Leifsonia sp. ZF2019]
MKFIRNFVVPTGALLALLSQLRLDSDEVNWSKLAATLFGFVLIVGLLNGLNIALFARAARDTWRSRVPSIFVDIVRLLLIVACLALLFAWVWGADVGGLFTALGVSSIVIGLALQNAVGPIVSGLFLLFEQPFRLGDWLDTGSVRGRVIEVNWRAVHIDTGNGIHIVPNGALADASFANLSRGMGAFSVITTCEFGANDAPHDVIRVLREVAADLPMREPNTMPTVALVGPSLYSVDIPLGSPAVGHQATSLFGVWLWYASRRAGLHLDGADFPPGDDLDRRRSAIQRVRGALHASDDEIDALADESAVREFGPGETVQRQGVAPEHVGLMVKGRARLVVGGNALEVAALGPSDFVGESALTGQPSRAAIIADSDIVIVTFPLPSLHGWARSHPAFARDVGQTIDNRRVLEDAAIAKAAE